MGHSKKEKQVRVGVRELRANLNGLLRQACHGTSFLVLSRNEVIAEIGPPTNQERPRRVAGMLKAKIRIMEDFDILPADILSAIEGKED